MLKGDVVFRGEVYGKVTGFELTNVENIEEPIIIFAYSLTTELAFYVLNNTVAGIITEESSFATHGANILRCMQKSSDRRITWITGVPTSTLSGLSGKMIHITEDGYIQPDNKDDFSEIHKKKPYSPTAMRKRSIVEYDLTSTNYKICYWPHRIYNRLTYSIWERGLRKNLRLFGIDDALIELDNQGRIWFKNCPYMSDYISMATDVDNASDMLQSQIDMYHRFYTKLINNQYTPDELIDMSSDYFSIFLLFHETYEEVFLEALNLFKKELGDGDCYEVFNTLLQSKVDKWMMEEHILLIKKKDFLSDEKRIPCPPFTIYEDIEYTTYQFKKYLYEKGTQDFYRRFTKQILFYNRVLVAKEWKFVMIKLLSTRFSEMLKEQLPFVSFDTISGMTIYDVKKMLISH